MEFVLSFDMRAPQFGASIESLYASALDMAAWADGIGFNAIGLGEHHGSDDGYLPSPLVLASAMAGRTSRITLRLNVLLAPLYDPVKLAEDLAVLQLASGNRSQVVIGAGYRPSEFAMFGTHRRDRKRRYVDAFGVLRQAWTGQAFDYQGRPCRVTPVPSVPPPLLLGGAHPAVARRAAHIADGFYPPGGESWSEYRSERLALGKPDPGPRFHRLGPIFTYVSDDPDADWAVLAPHIEHCVQSYADWTVEAYGKAAGPFAAGVDLDALRASGAYQVLSAERLIEQIESMDDASTFILTPLLGGLDPAFAEAGLKRFEERVWPYVKHRAGPLPIPGR